MQKLLLLLALALPALALADPSAKQLSLSQQLVELLQMRDMFVNYLKECDRPENTSFDPKVAFTSDPGSFKGLSPQSAYWPEVVAIYDKFRTKACAFATPEKFTGYLVAQYAQKVSEQDLQAAINFYSTPSGKHLQAAIAETTLSFSGFASNLMNQAYEAARVDFQTEIHEVILKYKKKPR